MGIFLYFLFLVFYLVGKLVCKLFANDDDDLHELTNNDIKNYLLARNTPATLNNEQNNMNISSDSEHLNNNVQPSSSNVYGDKRLQITSV